MSSIDQTVLDGIRELAGDEESDFLQTLIQLFLDSAPAKIQNMKTALARGDSKTAMFEAHSLKSSSASLGAMAVSSLSAELEKETKTSPVTPQVLAKFALLEKEFAQAIAELQVIMNESSSSTQKAA
jgi:HPt (histidine-containing phosphotransfer) domain-containing protein